MRNNVRLCVNLLALLTILNYPSILKAEQSSLFEIVAIQNSASSSHLPRTSKVYAVRSKSSALLKSKSIKVSLPEIGELDLNLKTSKISDNGNLIYSGALHSGSKILGDLTLNINHKGEMLGSVNLLAPHYRGVFKGNNLTLHNETPALGCGGSVKFKKTQARGPGVILPARSVQAGVGVHASTIDLLGVYTPDALTTLGSFSRVISYFENQVEVANEAHTNSGSGVSIRLMGIVALPSKAADVYDTDLERLANPSDGYWDAVPKLRDWYGADLVSLAVGGTQSGSICGLAYTPSSENDLSQMSDYMYSVVSADTDSCQESLFAHEAGHNLGANHNQEDAGGGDAIYPYAYGYRFNFPYNGLTVKALTVMSYAPSTGYFSWVRYFSTPDANYNSYVTGIADQADNARAFRSTGPVVGAFKTARSSLPRNASSISLSIKKSAGLATFSGTLKRSSRNVAGAQSTLYFANKSSGPFRSALRIDKSSSNGRWRYRGTARKGYYKLCQAVCSAVVRLR